MQKSDFFFWGLAASVGGVLAASFLQFSAAIQAVFLSALVTSALIAWKKKTVAAILVAAILAGLTVGVVRGEQFLSRSPTRGRSVIETPHALSRMKSAFEASLDRTLPEPESSLAAGILLGRSAKFPADFVEALRRTSTMHIVAVSGYNITIVASSVLRLFELFRVPLLVSWWSAVGAVILFTLLVGAPASAVRAAIMGIVVLVGKRVGRVSPQRLALAFAAATMLFWRPDLLRFDIGFQLSFLATIGVFWMAPLLEEKMFRGRRLWGFARICAETLGAQLMVAPWILYRFGNLSVLGTVANIIVLPLLPLTMLTSFLAGMAGMAGSISAAFVAPLAFVPLAFAVWVIKFAGNLPLAAFSGAQVPLWTIALVYAILFAVLIRYWRGQPHDE